MTYKLANVKWGQDDLGRGGEILTWSVSLAGLQYTSSNVWSFTEQDFIDATSDAFAAWADVADIAFVEHVTTGDADIIISMDALAGNTVGLATYWFIGGSNDGDGIDTIVDATIEMDSTESWSPSGENSDLSFYAVVLHEIGHVLGLDHVDDATEIMNPIVSAEDLGDGDIEGISLLYGDSAATNDGANVLTITLTSGDIIFAKGGNDTITGNTGNDMIFGGAGNDTLSGGSGVDTLVDTLGGNTLNGNGNNDVLVGGIGTTQGNGGSGNDIILGGIGDDTLVGGSGNDTLVGDPAGLFFGDDILDGGTGTDFLQGGGGADVFIFRPSEGSNTIGTLNFNAGNPNTTTATGADFSSGVDQLDLGAFGFANAGAALAQFADVGGNTVFDHLNTEITLIGLSVSDLDVGDFII